MDQPSPNWEHFPHAPIVEAILFIESLPPPLLDEDCTESFREQIRQTYPRHETLEETTAGIGMNANGVTVSSVERSFNQHRFVSADGKQIVQLRHRGFAFNRFGPYPGWEQFIADAQQIWRIYIDHFEPEQIARVGVRYVNRITLPPGEFALSDYLQTAPAVPPDLGPSIDGFFLRLVIPDDSIPAQAILTEGTGLAPDEGSILTIDIDVTTTAIAFIEDLWKMAERLREFKNRVFFASITDRMREIFR